MEFLANDEDADGPAVVVDELPAAFAGWEISNLVATFNSQRTGVTLDLPGIASGGSPQLPVSGTLPTDLEKLRITVGVALPVQAGPGNAVGTGVPTGAQGVLEYTVTVPENLDPSDPILRTDLTNTATFTALAGTKPLSTSSSAVIEIDNPVVIDVTPSKSWNPEGQSFQPGSASSISIGATQASNVNVSSLRLQDPSDPALAPDGATSLPAGNPFNFVDFAGFTSPADPLNNLPAGADAASVEVYQFDGSKWTWATWDSSIDNDRIAGVRTAYTSTTNSIAPNTVVSQGFSVVQRATNRSTGAALSEGWNATNEVLASADAPDQPTVSKSASAVFTVAAEKIDVSAEKRFYTLPSGTENANLTGVTAGDTVGVVLRAINHSVPRSTTLDSLEITEPGAGSNAEFFGENLIFAGFDNSDLNKIWPTGATGGQLTWLHADGPTVMNLTKNTALPAAPAGKTITGFEIVFTGAIEPESVAEVKYRLKTNSADSFVAAGKTKGPLQNNIDVKGEKTGLPADTANASANITLVAPRIDVKIEKQVGPKTVLPGQDVVVQLKTEVATDGGRTKPTEIIVEDVLNGEKTFWDAFDAKQILPPITRPMSGESPATQAKLEIFVRDAAGDWVETPLATNPDENTPITVPSETTGVRFVYSHAEGFSQTTYVKPNISFTARQNLRSDASVPTSGEFDTRKTYENVATATGTGKLDNRVVTGTAMDKETVGIRGTENGTGPVPGEGVWADKAWAHDLLTSQSSAKSWTTQRWATTEPDYQTVELQDVAAPSADGAGTVFEAFNLTHIRPIYTSGAPGSGTVDSQLRWDDVTDVLLYNGTDWVSVTPVPGGNWMNADGSGFKGYTLTEEQQLTTVSVKLVLAEKGGGGGGGGGWWGGGGAGGGGGGGGGGGTAARGSEGIIRKWWGRG